MLTESFYDIIVITRIGFSFLLKKILRYKHKLLKLKISEFAFSSEIFFVSILEFFSLF